MLSRRKVLQTINYGKRKLGIKDFKFYVKYVTQKSEIGKKAEIVIFSENQAEILLYPNAELFSVNHELCHAKLFRMGIPLTNTKKDETLFPDPNNYMRMVVIVEWYTNELQKRVFNEYYAIDKKGSPRSPPFSGLPKLPKKKFTLKQIRFIIEMAKRKII